MPVNHAKHHDKQAIRHRDMLKHIQAADIRIFHLVFTSLSHSTPAIVARRVSCTADGWLYGLLAPAFYLTQPEQARTLIGLTLAGFLLERAIYFLLKRTCKRRRPPDFLQDFESLILAADEFSFPSGHTSAAFFAVTLLVSGGSLVFLPLYLWATAVGLSRVILGVHFPTDILAGAVLGTSLALALPL